MNTRAFTFVSISIAAICCVLSGCRPEPQTLVKAWQLIPSHSCRANYMADPVVSWAPDSSSLLFAAISPKDGRSIIRHWRVGDQRAVRVTDGVSPNYTSQDTFVFLQSYPKTILEHNLSTNEQREVVKNLSKLDLYRDVTGLSYDPVNRNYQLRVYDFTEFYQPGCIAIDSSGREVGQVESTTGGKVLDRSVDPHSGKSAVIYGDDTARELRISDKGKEDAAKGIASGNLAAVAWRPDGSAVAFSDFAVVKIIDPAGGEARTIARLAGEAKPGRHDHVCRLVWSPDGKYLAAFKITSYEMDSFAVLYVLDVTGVNP